ncbi:uncharacterized protein AMSG_04090 [Thecamonas trahens ATCC 50062]|uniref:DUF4442 domain-containing protein n=1 Tax=Thecamonas trahens ATCC 50062 TaxID=461836 RepID=A0A0L0D6N4_THETB|nr:hypothetical protein AMSG_04090 [Thecamonas trahens ATCC 50062]KNC47860.1 hypothetical protein AMSG_04090 [Thecamonas trahens ATCC 50062]|eukprot:XP_013759338.1 hypothetical protein AMSG_04090 [Thecamonas trahens ATCC 50062]
MRGTGGIVRVAITVLNAVRFMVGAWCTVPLLGYAAWQHGLGTALKFERLFKVARNVPCGRDFISGLCGFISPYTGSISPFVLDMSPDGVSVAMIDRPWLRNPFNSLHAVALTNLGELTSALAMMMLQQSRRGMRIIPTAINAEFKIKARGTITASVGELDVPTELGSHTYDVVVPLLNEDGAEVAVITVSWRVTNSPVVAPSTVASGKKTE